MLVAHFSRTQILEVHVSCDDASRTSILSGFVYDSSLALTVISTNGSSSFCIFWADLVILILVYVNRWENKGSSTFRSCSLFSDVPICENIINRWTCLL